MKNQFQYAMAVVIACSCWLSCNYAHAQSFRKDYDWAECVSILEGATVEELDESVMERYSHFLEHPLRINGDAVSRLVSSGILSRYQVASIADYRQRNGDVLTITELGLIDGFNERIAKALAPFISLISERLPGAAADSVVRFPANVVATTAYKQKAWSYDLKYVQELGHRVNMGLHLKSPYDKPGWWPGSRSWYVQVNGKRTRVVVGDYNLRFGQGLCMWSGFSLSGLGSPDAVCKRPSGLAPTLSLQETGLRGVAVDLNFSLRLGLTAFSSVPGLRKWANSLDMHGKPAFLDIKFIGGANLTYSGRNCSLGMTMWYAGKSHAYRTGSVDSDTKLPAQSDATSRLSADFRVTHRGHVFFGEVALDPIDKKSTAVVGASLSLADRIRLVSALRYYPSGCQNDYTGALRSSTKTSDEYGISIATQIYNFYLTSDFVTHPSTTGKQLKLVALYASDVSGTFSFKIRMTERLRNYSDRNRTEFRTDFSFRYGQFSSNVRLHSLLTEVAQFRLKSLPIMTYAEQGFTTDYLKLWFRAALFRIPTWNDRIYVYERDVTGSFNVPALYGSGYAISAVAGTVIPLRTRSVSGRLKFNFRASYTAKPWNARLGLAPKPSVLEVKMQVILSFY